MIFLATPKRYSAPIYRCQYDMKVIVYALEAYRKHHGDFPPAYSTDEDGNVLHSWRVLILPYFDDEDLLKLYENIRLDEPWDSEWNTQYHERSPRVFQCLVSHSRSRKDFGDWNHGLAHYYMIIDDNDRIVPENSFLFAERKEGHNWMNPHHEIRLADVSEKTNSNPDGITSYHRHYYPFYNVGGANVCTYEFEIKWISDGNVIYRMEFMD
jgi:hypothetical protein